MTFSTTRIEAAKDCDLLLRLADSTMQELAFQQTSLKRKSVLYESSATGIQVDRAGAVAEIASLQAIVDGLPEGDTKEENNLKLTKARLQLIIIEERKKNSGIIAVLEKEMELDMVQRQLDGVEAFSEAITSRKQILTQSPVSGAA